MEIFINKSCLIKFKTELLSQTAVLIVHLLTHLANMGDLAVVELAVVKNKFHVFHELADAPIALLLQLSLYRAKVHWLLHDVVVVGDVELLYVDWLCEDPGR